MSTTPLPLLPFEQKAKTHAILCTVGFLILLPIGALVARYGRNFTNHWFKVHFAFQLFIAGPIIFVGWSMGYKTSSELLSVHFFDRHQKIGLALLILYVAQLALGLFIHYVKMPSLFRGHRPPQNYLHGILGISIFALAAYQVHYGLYTEWLNLGGGHEIPDSAKHAWLGLIIAFWALYVLGLAFVPRQYKKEREARESRKGY